MSGTRLRWLGSLSIVFLFLGYLARLSWRKWPDLLIDFGHELYIPWRMASGEMLYRDLAFPMGPLSQSWHALLFTIFGESLTVLIYSNLVVLGLICLLSLRLFSDAKFPGTATFLVLFFLCISGFSQYSLIGNYNYLTPYRHEVTHGLLFGLGTLACWREHDRNHSIWSVFLAGLLTGLCLLTKTELALPALVVTAVTAIRRSLDTANWFKSRLYWLVLGALLPLVLAWLILAILWGPLESTSSLLLNWQLTLRSELTSGSPFYRALAGLDNPWLYLRSMGTTWGLAAGLFVIFLLIDRMGTGVRPEWFFPILVGSVSACFLPNRFPEQYRSIPQLFPGFLLIYLVISGVKSIRASASLVKTLSPKSESRIRFALYSLLLIVKQGLNPQWEHYGFVLAAPATMLFFEAFFSDFPDWLRRRGFSGWTFRALAFSLLLGVAFTYYGKQTRIFAERTKPIGEGGDLFYVDPKQDTRTSEVLATIERLEQSKNEGATLLVLPDGSMLNYLLRMQNPSRHVLHSPWEVRAWGGDSFWEELERSEPEFIVIIPSDLSIHGTGPLGSRDYGERFIRWLEAHYAPFPGDEKKPSQPGGSMVLYRKLSFRPL